MDGYGIPFLSSRELCILKEERLWKRQADTKLVYGKKDWETGPLKEYGRTASRNAILSGKNEERRGHSR